jgi:2-desacetyl-2-hydroxyethyl bacteriochlorophyllide A dehydrogenase
MKRMRAAILYGPKDIRLESIEMPKVKPDWVLIKVRATGICGSDLHFYKEKPFVPIISEIGKGRYVPGHEFSGEVYKLGLKVKGLKEGDRVGVEPIVGCGKCQWCKVGWYNLCEHYKLIGFHFIGGMAEYCVAPAENCFKLSDNVSFESAAMLDCIAVAIHAVNKAEIRGGDSVLIVGAGTIGLFALQAALIQGASDVYVVGKYEFQLEKARKLGATAVINAKNENFSEKIMEITSGKGVDKVIEAVGGASSVISDVLDVTRKKGTIVTTGIFTRPLSIDFFKILTKELTITSSWGYCYFDRRKEFEIALDFLAKEKINTQELITHKYPLEKVSEAFETSLNKDKEKSMKVEIIF